MIVCLIFAQAPVICQLEMLARSVIHRHRVRDILNAAWWVLQTLKHSHTTLIQTVWYLILNYIILVYFLKLTNRPTDGPKWSHKELTEN